MYKSSVYLGLLITIFALASCSQKAPVSNPAYPNQPKETDPYPSTGSQPGAGDPYPTFQIQPAPAYPNATEIDLSQPPEPPTAAPAPEKGKASISGALYSWSSKMRIAGTYAFITAEPERSADLPDPLIAGPKKEAGDITFTTDEKGNFEVNNIAPGKYIIVVWAPYTWDFAQVSELDKTTLVLELKADTKNPLGVVYVAWP